MSSPIAFVLIGPPGAGKSTWRTAFLADTKEPTTVLSTDDSIEAWGATHGLTYSEAFKRANFKQIERDMFAMMAAAVARGSNIIIDRTNMTVKSRARFLSLLPQTYYRLAIAFEVPKPTLLVRLAERARTTGKFIPLSVVDSMLDGYEPPTAEEFHRIRTL